MLRFFGFFVALLGLVGSTDAALLEYNFTSSANASTVEGPFVNASAYQGFGNQAGQQFSSATFGNTPTNTGYQIGAGRWSTWDSANTNKHRTISNAIDNSFPFADYSGFSVDVNESTLFERIEINYRSDATTTRALNFQVYYQVDSNAPVKIFDRSQNVYTGPDAEDGFYTFSWVNGNSESNEILSLAGVYLNTGSTFKLFVVGSNPGAAGANLVGSDGTTQSSISRSYDLGYVKLISSDAVVPEPASMVIFGLLGAGAFARKLRRKA